MRAAYAKRIDSYYAFCIEYYMTAPLIHTIEFERNTVSDLHKASCSCGWFHIAPTLLECQLRASVHDLGIEWQPVSEAAE